MICGRLTAGCVVLVSLLFGRFKQVLKKADRKMCCFGDTQSESLGHCNLPSVEFAEVSTAFRIPRQKDVFFQQSALPNEFIETLEEVHCVCAFAP
ncbi:hypothetical protein TNCV_5100061 [Trichonephila clavipes]|uniref:Secreted protein n=1 Tax=Trichonephila clavipes TaxID=2585209 RepID=A0A8X6S073_TRICX|nr:hypothetical protein TNCV_5100061 [Trichonephila clavipes]